MSVVSSNSGDAVQLFAFFVDPYYPNVWVPPPAGVQVEFRLENTSNLKGYAMNAGWGDQRDDAPDYTLMRIDGQGSEGDSIIVDFGSEQIVAHVALRVKDYGGSTQVRAMASNGFEATALRLPVDSDGNGLPDIGWVADGQVVQDNQQSQTQDIDPAICSAAYAAWHAQNQGQPPVCGPSGPPSQGFLGDGLTMAEEFRGFVVRGVLTRTSPQIKDLFIAANLMYDGVPLGLAYAVETQGLPMRVHHVYGETDTEPNEYGQGQTLDRAINVNGATMSGHFDQGVLLLLDFDVPPPLLGGHAPIMVNGLPVCPNGGSTPNETSFIAIDIAAYEQEGLSRQNSPVQIARSISFGMGHEVGHGVHVKHRGGGTDACVQDSAQPGQGDSLMSQDWHPVGPNNDYAHYNDDDRQQMRLHAR